MTARFTLAYNELTDRYELHAAGCAHLNLGKFQGAWEEEAENAAAAKAKFEFGDAVRIHKISPCVKKEAA